MLREISGVRQEHPELQRRWFQDDYFDLFVWSGPGGEVVAFQLSYDRSGRECTLGWHRDKGYMHRLVDGGEVGPHSNLTPLLVEGAGRFPKQRVIAELDARGQALDPSVRMLVRGKAVAYVSRSRRGRA